VQLLHQANPQAALSQSKSGSLPLHIAAANQDGAKGTEAVEALLRAELKAVTVANQDGDLPLHRAAHNQGLSSTSHLNHPPLTPPSLRSPRDAGGDKGTAVVELLLQASPEALNVTNQFNQTPLDMALRRGLSASDPLITLLETGAWQEEWLQAASDVLLLYYYLLPKAAANPAAYKKPVAGAGAAATIPPFKPSPPAATAPPAPSAAPKKPATASPAKPGPAAQVVVCSFLRWYKACNLSFSLLRLLLR
jgi:hypothetical protein